MKLTRQLVIWGILTLMCGSVCTAQELEQRQATRLFTNALKIIENAEAAEGKREKSRLLHDALDVLRKLQINYPRYYPDLIAYRTRFCREQLAIIAAPEIAQIGESETVEALQQENRILLELFGKSKVDMSSELAAQLREAVLENHRLRKKLAKQAQVPNENGKHLEMPYALTELSKAKEEFEDDRRVLQEGVARLQKQNEKLRAELKQLSMKDLEQRRLIAKLSRTDFRKKLDEYESRLKDVKRELGKAEMNNDDLTAKLARSQKRILALVDSIQALKAENNAAIKKAMQAGDQLLAQTIKKIDEETKKTAGLRVTIKDKQQELDVLQASNADLRNELRRLRAKANEPLANELKLTLERLKKQLKQEKQKCRFLAGKVRDHLAINRSLQAQMEKSSTNDNSDIDELRQEIESLRESARLQEIVVQQLRQEKQDLASEREQQQTMITTLRERLANGEIPEKTSVAGDPHKVQMLRQQATASLNAGKPADAARFLEQALLQGPHDPQSNRLMATAKLALDAPDDALDYAVAAHQHTASPETARLIATIRAAQDQPELAVAQLLQADKKFLDNIGVKRQLGTQLAKIQWFDAAEKKLLEAWKLNQKDGETAKQLALLYTERGGDHMQSAKKWYSRAVALGVELKLEPVRKDSPIDKSTRGNEE